MSSDILRVYLGCSDCYAERVNELPIRGELYQRCGRNTANGGSPNVKSRVIPCQARKRRCNDYSERKYGSYWYATGSATTYILRGAKE